MVFYVGVFGGMLDETERKKVFVFETSEYRRRFKIRTFDDTGCQLKMFHKKLSTESWTRHAYEFYTKERNKYFDVM